MQEPHTASVDASITRVAGKLLRADFRRLRRCLRRCAKHPERPERVHKLRIATRRADAALSTFAPVLPVRLRRRLRRALREIRAAARSVRDLDVLIARMRETDQLPIARSLTKDRKSAARKLVQTIRDATDWGFVDRLNRIIKRVRWRSAEPCPRADRLGRRLLEPTLLKFRRAAACDLGVIEDLHQFRLRGKRMRYSLELLEAVSLGDQVARLKLIVQRLQGELGEINDHATAIELLSRIANRNGAINDLIAEERRMLAAKHAAFLERWEASGREETATAIHDFLDPVNEAG